MLKNIHKNVTTSLESKESLLEIFLTQVDLILLCEDSNKIKKDNLEFFPLNTYLKFRKMLLLNRNCFISSNIVVIFAII